MVGGISSMTNVFNTYGITGSQSIQSAAKIFDYKAAQQQTQQLLNSFKTNNATFNSLKKDSAQFLKQYTSNMNGLNQAANQLTGKNLDTLLTNKQGQVTEDSIEKTVDAMKNMVENYNDNIKFLNDNAERGSGVTNQLGRMVDDPASKETMAMLGVSVNKDGSLALDEKKLTDALMQASKLEDPEQFNLLKDAIGGRDGVATGVERDAQAGLREPAGNLISNDVATLQNIRESDPIRTYAKEVQTGGAYVMNNMAAGVMMNLLV